VTDPFLLSAHDEESGPGGTAAGRIDELALRSGLPRAILDRMPAEAVGVVEEFVTRVESWADLVGDLREVLEAAGFRQHDPRGEGGGYHIAAHVRDDGVLVSWATTQYKASGPGSFEYTVERIVQPALRKVLEECGFAAQLIPDGQDDAGCILVTGRPTTTGWSGMPIPGAQ
jgi:hypothetical protein